MLPHNTFSLEQGFVFLNELVHTQQGKYLSQLQIHLLQASWSTTRQNYTAIAKTYGYSENYLKYDAGPKLWHLLAEVLQEKVTKTNVWAAIERRWHREQTSDNHQTSVSRPVISALMPSSMFTVSSNSGQEIHLPDTSSFAGREEALRELWEKVVAERCRVLAIVGMGGIGKTALVAEFVRRLQQQKPAQDDAETEGGEEPLSFQNPPFQKFIWRSLHASLPLDQLLQDLISCLDEKLTANYSANHCLQLIESLERQRCLIVLDQFETVSPTPQQGINQGLDNHSSTRGTTESGNPEYEVFLRSIAHTSHQSSVIVISREKPEVIARLEGRASSVQSIRLQGLNWLEGQAILAAKTLLSGTEQDWQDLIQCYDGNPFALQTVATTIQEFFNGNIRNFLAQGTLIGGPLRSLIEQQLVGLSALEWTVLRWLALNREPMPFAELYQDITTPILKQDLLAALEHLWQRSLLVKVSTLPDHQVSFTLSQLMIEFITQRMIGQIYQEIVEQEFDLLHSHALMKAQAKEYVRENQVRCLLNPVVDLLYHHFRTRPRLEQHLKSLLDQLRRSPSFKAGYAAGNLLNLLINIQADLTECDFSNLAVWQAYLQGAQLHRVNFSQAELSRSVFTKPLGGALSVVFSPDGEQLVTSDINGTIRLWQVEDGKQILSCEGHGSWVCLVAFSPNGEWLASAGEDHGVKIWSSRTGECHSAMAGHQSWVWSIAFSPNGRLLASASEDHTIRLWSLRSKQCLKVLTGHNSWVCSVAFSPNGNLLVSGGDDHLLRLWNVRTGVCSQTLWGHTDRVSAVQFSPDGQMIASASEDHTIKLWDIKRGECMGTFRGHEDWVWSIAFSPEGQTLISGSQDQTIRVWDVGTGQCLRSLQGHTSWVQSVAFSANGTTIASGSEDQTVRLWDVNTGHCLSTIQGYASWVQSVAFSPDGHILASSHEDHNARLWDVASGQCIKTLQGADSALLSVAFSPDGQWVAGGGFDHTVRLWQASTGKSINIFRGHSSWIRAIAFSPDGSHLLSSSGDCLLKLWDTQTGICLRTLKGHINWVWSVAFSPDGQWIASCGDDQTIRLWDAQTGDCLQILRGHLSGVTSVTFSPDSTQLVSSSADQTIKLWDIKTGTCFRTLQGHKSSVFLVTFSPEGRYLASSSADQTIKLWNVEDGSCLNTFVGHTNLVFSVAFNPTQALLASGSRDETIKIWQLETGECRNTLRVERPYEGMDITEASGLTDAQKATLRGLGAIMR